MGVVNVGVTIDEAQEIAKKQLEPAPASIYELQCTECVDQAEDGSQLKTKKGRPQVYFTLAITGAADPDLNGKQMRVYCMLPHKGDNTWLDRLIKLTKALGPGWNGTGFNTEDFIGKTCRANVVVSDDGKWNEIESYV